jgi:hypothetical protein
MALLPGELASCAVVELAQVRPDMIPCRESLHESIESNGVADAVLALVQVGNRAGDHCTGFDDFECAN